MKCIPGVYLMILVERMPRVCKAVIKAKGSYFEENILTFGQVAVANENLFSTSLPG